MKDFSIANCSNLCLETAAYTVWGKWHCQKLEDWGRAQQKERNICVGGAQNVGCASLHLCTGGISADHKPVSAEWWLGKAPGCFLVSIISRT